MIFTLTELLNKVLGSLTIRQLKMIIDNHLPVSLDLDIDYSAYPGRVNHKIFFSTPNFTDCVRYSETFLE